MRIAITGARGTVGRAVVQTCLKAGHAAVQINRTSESGNSPTSDPSTTTETRVADIANNYTDTVNAFRGCDAVIHLAAIPSPVGKPDSTVHNNNVTSAFNGFRAAAELDIRRFCYASSVNALGLVYANQPLKFDYFPIDEEAPTNPTDAYALAKVEAEIQARAMARWFPGMNIACLRIHEVAPLDAVRKQHADDPEGLAVRQLWGWVHPDATARACLLAVERGDAFRGCEVFNIVAPGTTQSVPSEQLARRYYPAAAIRGDLSGNQGFWTTDKAFRVLGWVHHETE